MENSIPLTDIRLWGLYEQSSREFEAKIENEMKAAQKRSILTFINMNIDQLLIELVIVGIYIVGVMYAENEKITIGAIIVFITYCTYILAPLSSVLNIFFVLSGIKPSLQRVETYLQEEEPMDQQKKWKQFRQSKWSKFFFHTEKNRF